MAEQPVATSQTETASQPSEGVRTRPSLDVAADQPVESAAADYFGYEAYATALAELIDNKNTSTPLTIAINAPWGAGKTSLGKLLESKLRERAKDRRARPHAFVWFDAWKHDAAEHLGAAFAADVARKLGRQRPIRWRVLCPLPGRFLTPGSRWWRRFFVLVVLLFSVALLLALVPGTQAVVGKEASEDLEELRESVGPKPLASVATFLLVVGIVFGSVFRMGRAVASYVSDPRSEATHGSMDEVSRQIGALVRQAVGKRGGRRVVVFVDDLERCKPPRALEVCEVAAQLLPHKNVIVVLLADMSVIASSADVKYAPLEESRSDGPRRGAYGRLYLQKLVQIEFSLPPTALADLKRMLEAKDEPLDQAGVVQAPAASTRVDWWPQVAIGIGAASGLALSLAWPDQDRIVEIDPVEASAEPLGVALVDALVPWGVGGAVVGSVLVALGRLIREKRAERAQRQIDEEIDAVRRRPFVDLEDFEQEVLASKAARRRPGLAKQRLRNSFVDDAELKREATAKILEFLPRLPRSAKRMSNHLRFLLVVAYERKMFGGEPKLTAGHIGKWVVLSERWPELARFLSEQPLRAADYERAARDANLDAALEREAVNDPALVELVRFLREEPELGVILPRLVHLEPAEPPSVPG